MADQGKKISVAAFLVGGILGASASLLFAPKSGEEIRGNIKAQAEGYLQEVKSRMDKMINRSKSSAELLKGKAEDILESVKLYANGKMEKPLSVIEKEITGLRAAITALKATYSIKPDIHESITGKGNGQITLNEFEDETLPKHIGMGKGKNLRN